MEILHKDYSKFKLFMKVQATQEPHSTTTEYSMYLYPEVNLNTLTILLKLKLASIIDSKFYFTLINKLVFTRIK